VVVPGSLPSNGLGRAVARQGEAGHSKNSIGSSAAAERMIFLVEFRNRSFLELRSIWYAVPGLKLQANWHASDTEGAKMAAIISSAPE